MSNQEYSNLVDSKAEKSKIVKNVSYELPKSFIVYKGTLIIFPIS